MVLGGTDPDGTVQLKCRPFTTATPEKPVPQSDPLAIERFHTINQEVRSGPHTILFLGDSLTQKWDPSVWDRYFGARGGLNAGVNGDRTEHLLWRLENGNLDGTAPALVVLMIGTNDIGRNRPADMVAEGVRRILQVLRGGVPTSRILLLGILPRSEAANSRRRRQVAEVNRLIETCADREHIFYADFGDKLLDPKGDPEGRLTRAVSPDGVHLSRRGYTLLAAPLAAELDKILGVNRQGRYFSDQSAE